MRWWQWVFSGIGAVLFAVLLERLLGKNRRLDSLKQKQKTGPNSPAAQAGGDATITHQGSPQARDQGIVQQAGRDIFNIQAGIDEETARRIVREELAEFERSLAETIAERLRVERLVTPEPSFRPVITLPAGTKLARLHAVARSPLGFVPPGLGLSRFQGRHASYPILYLADTCEGALSEFLSFYPRGSGPDPSEIRRQYTEVELVEDLALFDFTLRGAASVLGIPWESIVAGPDFQVAQEAVAKIRMQHPEVQGLRWPSRILPNARLVALFGDRVGEDSLAVHHTTEWTQAPCFGKTLRALGWAADA